LAAALMRAVGIPARIVNGVTLKKPFDVNVSGQILTLNMAEGRHSWIEVYFPVFRFLILNSANY
jgi:transglutaminase-like putative cysteine protease